MSGQHVTWSGDTRGHGGVVEQTHTLEQLLAGLDELSGTLPDLGAAPTPRSSNQPSWSAAPAPSSSNQSGRSAVRLVHRPLGDVSVSRQLSVSRESSILSDMPARSAAGPPIGDTSRRPSDRRRSNDSRISDNGRTYEDDLDYVLEKEVDIPIKGQERRPLIGVDNYQQIYEERRDGAEPQPYHTRHDSKPFSYIRQNPSRPSSRTTSRCSSREGLDGGRGRGLESPSLLKRVIGGGGDFDSPSPSPVPPRQGSLSPAPSSRDESQNGNPELQNESARPVLRNGSFNHELQSGSPSALSSGSSNSIQKFVHSQTFQSVHNTDNIYAKIGQGVGGGARSQSLDRSGLEARAQELYLQPSSRAQELYLQPSSRAQRSVSPERTYGGLMRTQSLERGEQYNNRYTNRQMITIQTRDKSAYNKSGMLSNGSSSGVSQQGSSSVGVEGSSSGGSSLAGDGLDGRSSRTEEDRETWLLKQQRKLLERRNSQQNNSQTTRGGTNVIQELKTSLYRARSGATETTDGYVSDANSVLLSETSRESSPAKPIYNIPVKRETNLYNGSNSQLSNNQNSSNSQYNNSNGFNNSFNNSSSFNTSSNLLSSTMNDSTLYSTTNATVNSTNNHSINSTNNFSINSSNNQSINSTNDQSYNSIKNQSINGLSYDDFQNSSIYSSINRTNGYSGQSVSRQLSDSSYDRLSRPEVIKKRHDSESEVELDVFRNGFNGHSGHLSSRPETPGFPVASTPYFNQSTNTLPPKIPGLLGSRGGSRIDLGPRAPSPAGSMYQGEGSMSASRRGSLSSEPTEVSANHVKLVKDNHKFWYKKNISRDEAISILTHQQPGTFIVRDSNSFPGAFGLALKVATPPANKSDKDSSELVRHFLIEPTSKGVKLKGYSNEPVFASLSALIYQHTVTALALPCRLVLPSQDLGGSKGETTTPEMEQLLQYGAACNVYYLFSQDTDQLTGPQAVRKAVSQLILTRPLPQPTVVHFKVSGQGITLTDQSRRLFFRKHYSVGHISHCGVDPEDRRWTIKDETVADKTAADRSMRLFAFVARKPSSPHCNQCHVFSELDPEQPARAIVNFVNKLLVSGGGGHSAHTTTRHSDMV